MKILVHRLGTLVQVSAEMEGLIIRGPSDLSLHDRWPQDALNASGGWRTAREIEQLIELGLAEARQDGIVVPFENFETLSEDIPFSLISAWSKPSPFLLKIDRYSDIGRRDFQYRYAFILQGRVVPLQRVGYYVQRNSSSEVFLLDTQMYSLLEAMDGFNALPPEKKTQQVSWLTFAKVKGCANSVGAALDATLQSNDVVVPSSIGLDIKEDAEGAITFLPKCAELSGEEFHQAFERNKSAENFYSLDRPGLSKVRIVLTDEQHRVLQRMKLVRQIRGDKKKSLIEDPGQVFDGVGAAVELPYGERVTGIGDLVFKPIPVSQWSDPAMARLWKDINGNLIEAPAELISESPRGESFERPGQAAESSGDPPPAINAESEPSGAILSDTAINGSESENRRRKYLIIDTNDEKVREGFVSEAERAAKLAASAEFQRPKAFREDRNLHPHQEQGVRWLQTCSQIPGRKGVLLADDMGVGKTVQILTFLAWCIESGKFPDLSKSEPPFRPILIVAPLILLDTRNWEREMDTFFSNQGVVFWPVLTLHGTQLAHLRRPDAEGPEVEIGRPALDLDKIQRNRVVITNYETLKNYQHSFAYSKDGNPLWSLIVTDEAQEYKIPNTKISHAIKALTADLRIACTGTPVENRLLDLWNICDSFQPGLLHSAKEFADRYEKDSGTDLDALKRRLLFQQPHAFLLRRTKSEVANLPAKHIIKLDCVMSEKEIAGHYSLLNDLRRESKQSKFITALQRFALIYQHPALLAPDAEDQSAADLVSQSSKLQAVIRQLHAIRAKREKVIVFARHRVVQGILAKVFSAEFKLSVRIINGETQARATSLKASGIKTRNAILDDFKARPGFNILILSPFVAGIGLTIIEANHVIHYGRWWNPAVESQATDRAYRIGQPKEVSVYLPILRDPSGRVSPSFDERLDALMEKKQRLAEDFLRPLPAEEEMVKELFADLSAKGAPA